MAAPVVEACPRCKHHHGHVDKCKTCGHYGRSVIFPGPGDAMPPPAEFRLETFDSKTPPIETSTGYLRLAQLMRNQVFIAELKMVKGRESKAASGRRTEIQEVDDHEGSSRHIIGLVGDAPVSYARWRVMRGEDVDGAAGAGGVVVVVDRLLVLSEYRHRGYGKATFGRCLMDIMHMIMEANVPVQRISIFVPVEPRCMYAAQTVLKFGLESVVTRPADPTGTASPEFFKDAGVQEFSVLAATLLAAYQAAGAGGAVAAAT